VIHRTSISAIEEDNRVEVSIDPIFTAFLADKVAAATLHRAWCSQERQLKVAGATILLLYGLREQAVAAQIQKLRDQIEIVGENLDTIKAGFHRVSRSPRELRNGDSNLPLPQRLGCYRSTGLPRDPR
jgi:hypothetical protein